MRSIIIFLCSLIVISINAQVDTNNLSNWPANKHPKLIGNIVAKVFLASPHNNFSSQEPPKFITYPEVCTWYGALKFSKVTNDKTLDGKLFKRFQPLFGNEATMLPPPNHVDYNVFGALPLELYMHSKEKKYLKLGLQMADLQWQLPDTAINNIQLKEWEVKGLTWQTRMWIDDMYMISLVQAQAYKATGKSKYIERAAKEMSFYLDSLQQSNGLFFHAPDVPFYWGRGNGWMAAGMSELLRVLPEKNEHRQRILKGYREMMAALLQYQDKYGLWRQLINDKESWIETSGSGMFTFALIMGVKNGWLDKKIYTPVARKAWLALVSYLDENGKMREVCQGTNKRNDRQYYLDRKRILGDMHGQAPILWCAAALLD